MALRSKHDFQLQHVYAKNGTSDFQLFSRSIFTIFEHEFLQSKLRVIEYVATEKIKSSLLAPYAQ